MSAEVALILGTRPEIIKLAPLATALGDEAEVIHTGQHYDHGLSGEIFRSCGVAKPAVSLRPEPGRDRAGQIGGMISRLGAVLAERRPRLVVVQGDTNTANAGAQAAHYARVPVLHVEAGLRSFDRGMPEEINRQVISVLADHHCCPTRGNAANLVASGVEPHRIHVTGNTVMEAVAAHCPDERESDDLRRSVADVEPERYVLATIHRPENTDDVHRLATVVEQLGRLGPVVFTVHPRTEKAIARAGLTTPASVRVVPPLRYRVFLAFARHARAIVSDSGGLQEEVTALRRPLVVVRTSTERPESLQAGFAVLAEPGGVTDAVVEVTRPSRRAEARSTPSPFGDGRASARIAALCRAIVAADRSSLPAPRSVRLMPEPKEPIEHAPVRLLGPLSGSPPTTSL